MHYLFSYDVQEDKSRTKIMKLLKSHGYHLQKSVFVLDLADPQSALEIYQAILNHMDLTNDRLFMVPLCQQCLKKKQQSGPTLDFNTNLWII